MATTNTPKEVKGWDKVVAWYARQAYAVGIVYSLGAAVVIVGALFKIMHWPGAGIVLTAGMCTEAFLFMIGIFEKPHASYHWEHVFPQLVGDETKELHGGNGISGVGEPKKESALAPSLSESDFQSLKDGISSLGKTAGQLAELGKMAEGSNKLTEKMNSASAAMEQFAGSQVQLAQYSEKLSGKCQQLGTAYENMQSEAEKAVEMTRNQQKNIESLNSQLSSINSVYELQLNALKSQAEAVKSQTESIKANSTRIDAIGGDMQKMQTAVADAVQNTVAYEDATKKLASQIADLNKIYGNMLNALA